MKRLCDLSVAVTGLLLLSPLLVAIGAVVAWSSGRPVLFRQRRIGWRGREFVILKFRTMNVAVGADAGSFDMGSSARVTRVGRILRAWKLDEVPQLWNVVRGEMSLVGPRPEVHKWIEVYPDRWKRVHEVRPGMTDSASILFRDEEALLAKSGDPERTYREDVLPRKLDLYEEYVRRHSLWGDFGIVCRTLGAIVSRR